MPFGARPDLRKSKEIPPVPGINPGGGGGRLLPARQKLPGFTFR
jgi:hypothetical protein